ncbi:site-specific DNA-methyltransferase [Anaerobium acetethylicum]|uniref:Adenine-specific DNA-methyltransferase n=1 Tax=Anaerobium acetethylicum TaxID=1619234 RepID=A0A1D3TXQ8_9FIRM|nr:site-specific DNA-methyltransferase [Anaerobium acetethylicum]SCP99137.1 adenine-specific DNA-methyltransferase [Anaerobium acetethylicum]
MDKLKMHSINEVDGNIESIGKLFPNTITEVIKNGKVEYAIDFDILRQELSDFIVEGKEERYQFTWPDKRKSILLANAPIAKTLRPCREESVDFDNTENLYIEGDNLDVLKLLKETYLGKIKMIYIDPPYNTGNDFVYEDNFAISADEYIINSGQYDENGNRLFQNTESNGRFHTDWLNMLYPRLRLAKDLLTVDGVIFISIDDNEVHNLRKIADEIFGESNFIGCFLWKKKSTSTNVLNALVSPQVDYQLCYGKTSELCLNRRVTSTELRKYPFSDSNGNYRTAIIEKKDAGDYARASMKFPILGVTPRDGKRWQIGEKTARDLEKRNRFLNDNGVIKLKIYDYDDKDTYSANPNLLLECGSTDSANKETNIELFKIQELFSNPKPTELLIHLLKMGTQKDSIILDFFSGSATTAHAVMKLNSEDNGKRKYIMVQLPEKTEEKSEALRNGYVNICEIGKERIRRAGKKVKGQNKNIDTGFRTFKLDSSNMKDVYYNPAEYEPSLFDSVMDNIKKDRTPEDLLFQIMIDLGVLLSSKIMETTINNKKVFDVDDGFLIACFDDDVTDDVVKAIAQKQPYYAVFRDSSMATDSVATNFDQIFATYSPTTVRKVL